MKIIGHRGASGTITENTLASFELAVSLGCPMIELDVHVCQSGELVVYHDFACPLPDGSSQPISNLGWDTLQKVRLPGDHVIPRLDEIIERFASDTIINIELKGTGTAQPVYELLRKAQLLEGPQAPLISSLSAAELTAYKKLPADNPLGLVLEKINASVWELAESLELTSLNPSKKAVNGAFIQTCHDLGLLVYVFTVNDESEYQRLKSMGADGIFTDYPEKFLPLEAP